MYALWRHPSCLHTLFIIVSSCVSLFRPFSPYSGLGSSSSHAEFVVVERTSSPYSGLGSSSSHAEYAAAGVRRLAASLLPTYRVKQSFLARFSICSTFSLQQQSHAKFLVSNSSPLITYHGMGPSQLLFAE
jgi:hypothetical protein